MTPILASRSNVYSGSALDRVSQRRGDNVWVEAALCDPASLFVPLWRGQVLVQSGADAPPQAVMLTGESAAALRATATSPENAWLLLGVQPDETAVFAVDLSESETPLPALPSELGQFVELRSLGGTLPASDAAMLGQARGMLHWRSRHRFCGVCGGVCAPEQAGHVMACSTCGAQHFPRTDPAVIMLVHDGARVLLGHNRRFPKAEMYSTLAGFVEPGESMEEAVRREVAEEAGIKVDAVQYHSSQPWPFPASIMIGFYARAVTRDIRIDPDELADARWFTRDMLRDPAAHGFCLPAHDSIARRLIEDWICAE